MDDIENISIVYLGSESRRQYVKAVRDNLPTEWLPVAFVEFVAAKDAVEFQVFIRVDGVNLRTDVEVAGDVVESSGWDKVFKTIREIIDAHIEQGVVEEIRASQVE